MCVSVVVEIEDIDILYVTVEGHYLHRCQPGSGRGSGLCVHCVHTGVDRRQ